MTRLTVALALLATCVYAQEDLATISARVVRTGPTQHVVASSPADSHPIAFVALSALRVRGRSRDRTKIAFVHVLVCCTLSAGPSPAEGETRG
jgi:hypothetical protein